MLRVPAVPFGLLVLALALAACGGSDDAASEDPAQNVQSAARPSVEKARDVKPEDFPTPRPGVPIEEFSQEFKTAGLNAIAATSVHRPPRERFTFGLLDDGQEFLYGPTVVYLSRQGSDKVTGPIAAPADVLLTEKKYRSRQAASEKDPFAAIYAAEVELPKPGLYNVLVVSDAGGERRAAGMGLQVVSKAQDKVPDVGEKAPKVETDTRASLKGNTDLLTTRLPPTPELAEKSFADVVGKKPVALLYATPQLCSSRVCGPVVDEMLQLKAKYGDRMTFIHQEVYVDNDPNKGLRSPLRSFALPTEPWLFTVGADGRIAARAEGSIGLDAFEDAVKAALRQ